MKYVRLFSMFSLLLMVLGCSERNLHEAAKRNDTKEIQRLLDSGTDIHCEYLLWGTPLHTAASHGSNESVLLLIKNGADVNRKAGIDDQTPLHRTVDRWNIETTEVLIKNGANPGIEDSKGRTLADLIKFYGPEQLSNEGTQLYLKNYKSILENR